MKKNFLAILIAFCATIASDAQEKKISLHEIWNETFKTKDLDELRSMKNGIQYTVLNKDQASGITSVDLYDYKTLENLGTLVSSAEIPEINTFGSYTFSNDESKVILATEIEAVYRHSELGIYYVYDLESKKVTKLAEYKIQEPTFSPDGTQVAYAYQNNIFIVDLNQDVTKQITTDGKKNEIINGITDWVYEEEFAFVRAFEWNADSSSIAFLRFNETEVPQFSMDIYGTKIYPEQQQFKYPKAGEENAKVSLHIYELETDKISDVNLGEADYIPRIKWMHRSNYLSIQTLNRHQNHLKFLKVNTSDNSVEVIMEEKDAAYVDIADDLTFLADDSFIWTSERDGYNHLYLYAADGKLIRQITKG
ncbi:MAG: DPP IV N-terminal domain-containing protein, partial [Eudoraea sp.]|nr:DPP IV N-terminal domain-containing protein [Eudoraea sp.]